MIKQFILYGSEGCHLCELADEICSPIIKDGLAHIDIVSDDKLVEQYGVHIPVLKHIASTSELYWPFTAEEVEVFVTQWN
ncbi:glutaredoxin family protein [Thalassotalea fusca]